MKKIYLCLLFHFFPIVLQAQLYNPFVSGCVITPAPLLNVALNGVGQLSFIVGNNGSSVLPYNINQEMIITITLSKGIPNHINPLAAIGGSFASKFNWLYDNVTKTYQAKQNQVIPSSSNGGSGSITIEYKVTGNSMASSPQNGFNINITPPPFTNGINPVGDDQASIYTYTAANISSQLNLTCFIQAYYIGSGMMQPALLNQGVPGTNSTQADTITVELHNATTPYALVASQNRMLNTDGTSTGIFPIGGTYYIAIKHRNAVETWSANPVSITGTTSYDFSNLDSKAFASNQVLVSPGVFAFYSGDINQDYSVDAFDYVLLDPDLILGAYGYLATDLNGDGSVDAFDYVILDPNIVVGITSFAP